MNDQSKRSVLKIFQNEEKWLINVSEESNMIIATLDNGRSCFRCSFCFKLSEKKIRIC